MRQILLAAFAATLILTHSADAKEGMTSLALINSAAENEAAGRYGAAMKQLSMAIRMDRSDPAPYMHASRVRLAMGDEERSAGNLHYAILRARRSGDYARVSRTVRTDGEFKALMKSARNQRILKLYDAVAAGKMTAEEARRRIMNPEELRDSLGSREPRFGMSMTPPSSDVEEALQSLPEQPQVICPTGECGQQRLDAALERADKAYAAEEYDEAAANYELALTISELGPTLTKSERGGVYQRVGICLRHMGMTQESVKLLRIAVKVLPDNITAAYELAASYSELAEEKKSVAELKRIFKKADSAGRVETLIARIEADEDFKIVRASDRYKDLVYKYTDR